ELLPAAGHGVRLAGPGPVGAGRARGCPPWNGRRARATGPVRPVAGPRAERPGGPGGVVREPARRAGSRAAGGRARGTHGPAATPGHARRPPRDRPRAPRARRPHTQRAHPRRDRGSPPTLPPTDLGRDVDGGARVAPTGVRAAPR